MILPMPVHGTPKRASGSTGKLAMSTPASRARAASDNCCGPSSLTTPDEVPDPQALGLWLDVNDERAQRGNTATMVFGVAHLVSYVSRFMTLHPGDLICTGTPPGVGMGAKPPRYLKAGDTMRLGIDGLGEQMQTVVAYTKA